GAQDADPARLADCRDHVAAVAEGENGKFDPQTITDLGTHGALPFPSGLSEVTSCKTAGDMASTRRGRSDGHPRAGAPARRRLAPGDRRRDLLRAAARLLTEHGVDSVQIAEVATASGVSRQLVYRFFPSRRALIKAILEDFADALTREFGRHALDRLPADLEEATRVFVEAACDTIEAQGARPWHRLRSEGTDAAGAEVTPPHTARVHRRG